VLNIFTKQSKNIPLVGIDLDGVIAIEDNHRYFKAKSEGVSSLVNYYSSLKPNIEIIQGMNNLSNKMNFRIYTARNNDLPHIKEVTFEWLCKQGVYVDVIHTMSAWKAPELLAHRVDAMVDNRHDMLKLVPWINKYVYTTNLKDFNVSLKYRKKFKAYTSNPNILFDKLSVDLLY